MVDSLRSKAGRSDGPSIVLAFDPGRYVGFARVDRRGRALDLAVVDQRDLAAWMPTLRWTPGVDVAVVGSGTGHEAFSRHLPTDLPRSFVDEVGTTLEARELWRTLVPASGFGRWLPRGLRHPAERIDDFAAWAIARRYVAERWGENALLPPEVSSELRPR